MPALLVLDTRELAHSVCQVCVVSRVLLMYKRTELPKTVSKSLISKVLGIRTLGAVEA